MDDLRKAIEENILKVTPGIEESLLCVTVKKLVEDLAIDNVQDLAFVTEADLLEVFRKKPILLRKLMKSWSSLADPLPMNIPPPESSNSDTVNASPQPSDQFQTPSVSNNGARPSHETPNTGSRTIPYFINWKRLPTNFVRKCAAGEPPLSPDRREAIRIIVEEMDRHCGEVLNRAAFRKVANAMVQKYPKSFEQIIEGQFVGDGVSYLVSKLEYRRDNVCRDPKRRLSLGTSVPRKMIKRSLSMSYGAVSWDPQMPVDENEKTQEDHRQTLIKLLDSGSYDMHEDQVAELMQQTYSSQRSAINDQNPTDEIISLWPFLGVGKHLIGHFCQLMGFDVSQLSAGHIGDKLSILTNKLLKVMSVSKFPILEKIKRTLSDTDGNIKDLQSRAAPQLLATYFKEDTDAIFVCAEMLSVKEYLQAKPQLQPQPLILVIGEELSVSSHFHLLLEGKVHKYTTRDFVQCFVWLFGAYYVFNMKYPKEVSYTLEYIQRFIFGINPTNQGTKGKRVNPGTVLNLGRLLATTEEGGGTP